MNHKTLAINCLITLLACQWINGMEPESPCEAVQRITTLVVDRKQSLMGEISHLDIEGMITFRESLKTLERVARELGEELDQRIARKAEQTASVNSILSALNPLNYFRQ